jgi:hypothetical protein
MARSAALRPQVKTVAVMELEQVFNRRLQFSHLGPAQHAAQTFGQRLSRLAR